MPMKRLKIKNARILVRKGKGDKMTLLIDNRTDFILTDEMEKTLEKVCLESLEYEEFETDCENGWATVTVDGCTAGGVKVVNGRAKNHYPKGLRTK